MLEADIQKQILEYLEWKVRGKFWRINTGAHVAEYKGKSRFVRYGSPGMADIIGVYYDEIQGVGIFCAIEVKKAPNKPTKAQVAFLKEVNDFGGKAIVAYSLEDVIEMFK